MTNRKKKWRVKRVDVLQEGKGTVTTSSSLNQGNKSQTEGIREGG